MDRVIGLCHVAMEGQCDFVIHTCSFFLAAIVAQVGNLAVAEVLVECCRTIEETGGYIYIVVVVMWQVLVHTTHALSANTCKQKKHTMRNKTHTHYPPPHTPFGRR